MNSNKGETAMIERTDLFPTFRYTCTECKETFERQEFAEKNAERLGLKIDIHHRPTCSARRVVDPTPRPEMNGPRERQYRDYLSDSDAMNADFD
jgi:hypothetical protein